MSVAFDFEVSGRVYTVARRYTLTGRTTLSVLRHDAVVGRESHQDITAETVKATSALIESTVGPYDVASRSWYSPQERGKLFFEANPAERRDVFGQALAIPEDWQRWHGMASVQLNTNRDAAHNQDLILENMGEPDRTPEEIQENIDSKVKECDEIKSDIEKWQGSLEKGASILAELLEADEKRAAKMTELYSEAQEEWATKAAEIDQRNDQLRAKVNGQTAHNQTVDHYRDQAAVLRSAIENLLGDDCPTCKRPHTAESSVVVANEQLRLQRELRRVEDTLNELGPAMAIPPPEYELKEPAPTREQFENHEDLPDGADAAKIEEVTDGVATCRDTIARLNSKFNICLHEITNLERDKQDAEALIQKRADTVKERDAYAEEARHWETVYELTSPRGVRQLMIDQSLGSVQGIANEILEILQPGTEVYFDTQTETGRETLDLLLSAPDGVRTVASRSGGAGSRIATAIRCSLAMEAARSHGMPALPFFVLDEPFDSNDAAGKENLRLFLHWLSDRVGTVLVVSHDAEILESIDTQIKLIKPAGETLVA